MRVYTNYVVQCNMARTGGTSNTNPLTIGESSKTADHELEVEHTGK